MIPSEAVAVIDARLLPGHEPDRFIETVRKALADEDIDIEPITVSRPTESPWETESFEKIRNVIRRHFPRTLTAPCLMFASSDSRFFRERGVPTYGVCPVFLGKGEIDMIHGIDERISEANLISGCEVFADIVMTLVT